MMSVILVEPETAENIGSVARVMKNFALTKLVLVNPQCDYKSHDAVKMSTHAKKILLNAHVLESLKQVKCDYLVATTALMGKDTNIPRAPLSPEQLQKKLTKIKTHVGLVFGRESSGLRNEELQLCDMTLTIPASPQYPTMNLSHAVGVVLYELYKGKKTSSDAIKPMGAKDKQILYTLMAESLDNLPFQTKEKKETQKKVWKRVIGKSFMTKKEALSLMGFFRKVKEK